MATQEVVLRGGAPQLMEYKDIFQEQVLQTQVRIILERGEYLKKKYHF